MHTKTMSDSDGSFSGWEKTKRNCPRCEKQEVFYRVWESDCGGFEDEKYKCKACGYYWWVDGPDS
jgi:transposase-like protein